MQSIFTKKVLEIVSKIPRGKVITYKEVARRAGSPRACRAVGTILHRNYRNRAWQLPLAHPKPIPCHRVICSDGRIGNYALGEKEKEKLLLKEGLKIKNHRIKMKKEKTSDQISKVC